MSGIAVVAMGWEDLAFLHWPADPVMLRRWIPRGLDLDLRDGEAWIGVVPFRMCRVRAGGILGMPGARDFCELNVRTYVRHRDQAGVWFFSLDAESALAVWCARRFYHLNYLRAIMRCEVRGEWVNYQSTRVHPGAAAANFEAVYRPVGPEYRAVPGSIEHWLTERYRLFAADWRGRLYCGEIRHVPWSLQAAEVRIDANTMTRELGLPLSGVPLAHFSRRVEVVAGRVTRI